MDKPKFEFTLEIGAIYNTPEIDIKLDSTWLSYPNEVVESNTSIAYFSIKYKLSEKISISQGVGYLEPKYNVQFEDDNRYMFIIDLIEIDTLFMPGIQFHSSTSVKEISLPFTLNYQPWTKIPFHILIGFEYLHRISAKEHSDLLHPILTNVTYDENDNLQYDDEPFTWDEDVSANYNNQFGYLLGLQTDFNILGTPLFSKLIWKSGFSNIEKSYKYGLTSRNLFEWTMGIKLG